MILLDTDALIEALRLGVEPGDWAISVITLIEFLRGLKPEKVKPVKEALERAFTVLPLSNSVIEKYCQLYSSLKRRGQPLPDADLLIAATAITFNAPLATWNTRHYNRLKRENLRLIDPAKLGIKRRRQPPQRRRGHT